jgi:hypothetical protein
MKKKNNTKNKSVTGTAGTSAEPFSQEQSEEKMEIPAAGLMSLPHKITSEYDTALQDEALSQFETASKAASHDEAESQDEKASQYEAVSMRLPQKMILPQ